MCCHVGFELVFMIFIIFLFKLANILKRKKVDTEKLLPFCVCMCKTHFIVLSGLEESDFWRTCKLECK